MCEKDTHHYGGETPLTECVYDDITVCIVWATPMYNTNNKLIS